MEVKLCVAKEARRKSNIEVLEIKYGGIEMTLKEIFEAGGGILFVVLGHVNQFYRDSQGIENSQTLIFIYAFHMPLFFILSGILFSEKTFHDLSFFLSIRFSLSS